MGQDLSTLENNITDNLRPVDSNVKGIETSLDDLISFVYERKTESEPVLIFVDEPISTPCDLVGKNLIAIGKENAERGKPFAMVVGAGPCMGCDVPVFYWYSNRKSKANGSVSSGWNATKVPEKINIVRAVEGYVKPKNMRIGYQILANKTLEVLEVVSSIVRDGNRILVDNSCAVVDGQKVEKDAQGTIIGSSQMANKGSDETDLVTRLKNELNSRTTGITNNAVDTLMGSTSVTTVDKNMQEGGSTNWAFWLIILFLIILIIAFVVYQSRKNM